MLLYNILIKTLGAVEEVPRGTMHSLLAVVSGVVRGGATLPPPGITFQRGGLLRFL